MQGLKNKSEINKDAAKLLHEKDYFAPSVHCSYYSCLQLMKYCLNSHFKLTEKEINSKVSRYTRNNKDGSHNFFISFLFNEIKTISNLRESNNFYKKIIILKKIRTTADYGKEEILYNKSNEALTLSSDIIEMIKKHLRL
ncbi:MAG: hypothetical protein ACLFVR_01065 [Thiohalospira sp.]